MGFASTDIFSPAQSFIERGSEMRRRLQFSFCFPPIYGIYDTGNGKIYVFGDYDGEIEDILSHEVIHWAVQKTAGKRASLGLDNVPSQLLRA